jgi:hypothetical protein
VIYENLHPMSRAVQKDWLKVSVVDRGETSYRVIKNRFPPRPGLSQIEHRMLFGYAVLLYNMWTVVNAIGADQDDDHSGRTGNTGRQSSF